MSNLSQMDIKSKQMIEDLDKEWVKLIIHAKTLGLSKEEVKKFFQKYRI